MQTAVSSFTRNLIGFFVFIAVSFGVTYAVQVYAAGEAREQQTAAALQAMLQQRP